MSTVIPSFHVVGPNIPIALYRAIKTVWQSGIAMRTQYDRKNDKDEYIDPPSRDAHVLVEVENPFAEPRYPPSSFCEIGAYIAEIFGLKDYKVVPISVLNKVAREQELSAEEDEAFKRWPYTYHQRLTAHPDTSGDQVDQLARAMEIVAQTPYTRRAMCTTAMPNIDPWLKEDVPCLRELQLRCVPEDDGNLTFCPTTMWRSRDLYKGWGDNVVAITFFLQWVAKQIANISGKKVRFGSYVDFSCSLHIYGQDFGAIGGDSERGLQSFFETFADEDAYAARALTSEMACEMLVLPQLRELLTPKQIEQWQFPTESVNLVKWLITELEEGRLQA